MPEIISCPSCNRQLRVPEDLLGQRVRCPTCGSMFTALIGSGSASPPPPPPPTPILVTPPRPSPPRESYYQEEEEPAYDDYDDRPRRRRRYRREPHRGATILTLGILSLVIFGCAPFFGIFAWVMASNDLPKMREGEMDPEGEGLTNAGRICGMIGTIIWVIVVLLIMFELMMGGGAFKN